MVKPQNELFSNFFRAISILSTEIKEKVWKIILCKLQSGLVQ